MTINPEREGKFIDIDKFAERDVLSKGVDGKVSVKDPEKLEELLKSLDERITADRDKRVVDTAVIKTDEPKSNDDQDERE